VSFPRIVCTLGTTTDDPAVIAEMAAAGMGLGRINSAYAALDEIAGRIDLAHGASIPVMLDLKGPQLRVDCTTDRTDEKGVTHTVPCRYPIEKGGIISVGFGNGPVRFNHDFSADLEVGDLITFDNGTIRTRVVDGAALGLDEPQHGVLLEVLDAGGGKMTPQMGANVPGKRLDVPRLSDRDRRVIALGVEKNVEQYALSFVRDADDVLFLDEALAQAGSPNSALCVKIEEKDGIDNLEKIVAAARRSGRQVSVMIARGDLFVELPRVQLPRIQADLLRRCREIEVPSIVATGLLLSMQNGPTPARSEVCDVAAALTGGADSLMLSDETSNGKNPALAVRTLAELIDIYQGESHDQPE
jgi:pyruvate kinase